MGADERVGVAWMGASLCLDWHKFSWHKFALSLPSGQRRGRERGEREAGGAWVICCSFGVHDALTCFQLLLQSTALPAKRMLHIPCKAFIKGYARLGV